MAIGDVTSVLAGDSFAVEIMASVIAANGAPSGASAGVGMNELRIGAKVPSTLRILVKSTAGSGTMTAAARIWLYYGSSIGWVVAKTLNAGSNIAETGADSIAYSEEMTTAYGAARIYMEITAIAGTSTAVTGYALVGR